MSSSKKSKVMKRIIKIAGIVVISAIFILYVLLPIGIGWFSTWRSPHEVGTPPAGFKEVTLTASDNEKLFAWYIAPKNNCVIILLHGATGSREGIRQHAEMLAKNNYGVLAYDLRGHGESGGRGNAYGWSGTKDLGTAIKFLAGQSDVKSIGGVGLSLGGEILLGAASDYPQIKAIVSDGATSRSTGDYITLPKNKSFMRNYFTRVVFKTVQIISGETPPVTISDSISKAKSTDFLFVAAGSLPDEIEFNSHFSGITKGRSGLWIAVEAGHTGAYAKYPGEYEKRIIGFFTTKLINNK